MKNQSKIFYKDVRWEILTFICIIALGIILYLLRDELRIFSIGIVQHFRYLIIVLIICITFLFVIYCIISSTFVFYIIKINILTKKAENIIKLHKKINTEIEYEKLGFSFVYSKELEEKYKKRYYLYLDELTIMYSKYIYDKVLEARCGYTIGYLKRATNNSLYEEYINKEFKLVYSILKYDKILKKEINIKENRFNLIRNWHLNFLLEKGNISKIMYQEIKNKLMG
ncbi:MAG: hypothetical protein RSE00_05735 [Clostridia bacterium]